MKKEIKTDRAPLPIGPYSQGIEYGNLIFVAGQIPIDEKGILIEGDIEKKTEIVLNNIRNILEESGSDMSKVLYVQIFLKDIYSFSKVNSVYEKYFTPPYPARVVVGGVELPKGSDIEITVIAYR